MTVTVNPGDLVRFDPSDEKVIVFDFDERNLAAAVELSSWLITITPIRQNGVGPLTKDGEGLVVGNRKVQARFLATTATLGDLYEVAIKGITNETPQQKKEYSIRILVENG